MEERMEKKERKSEGGKQYTIEDRTKEEIERIEGKKIRASKG